MEIYLWTLWNMIPVLKNVVISSRKTRHSITYEGGFAVTAPLEMWENSWRTRFSVFSQWAKHVVLLSSREHTTEQIIIIPNIVTSWTRATCLPSVLCRTLRFLLFPCVCMLYNLKTFHVWWHLNIMTDKITNLFFSIFSFTEFLKLDKTAGIALVASVSACHIT